MIFKEWLVLESIREDVYNDVLERILIEKAAESTLRFFLESLEEEDDDGPVELDDPFESDPEQIAKAKPVSIADGEDEDDAQDDYTGDWRSLPGTRISVYGKNKEPQTDVEQEKSRIELANRLKNAVLWTRWNAILKRKRLIDRLKEIDDDMSLTANHDEEIADILSRLGYIDKQKLSDDPDLSEKGYHKEISSATKKAIEEKGNDLPEDITEEEIEKNAESAKKEFFDVLKTVFAGDYKRIASSGRNIGMIARKKGFKLFGDEDEVANNFILRMFNSISERPWAKSKNEVKPWKSIHRDHPEFGKIGKKEIEGDDFAEKIIGSFRSWLYKEPSKAERESRKANSPSAGTTDSIQNRDKKKSRINIDVQAAMKARTEGKPDADNSLKTYLDYIDAARKGTQGTFQASNEADRFRVEIMQHIDFLHTRYPDLLSLNPSEIIKTLTNYRQMFLSKSRSSPIFTGSMGGDNDEKGSWDAAAPSDDSDRRLGMSMHGSGRGATGEGDLAGKSSNSASIALGNEQRVSLFEKLKSAMMELKSRNPSWAWAVCIKLGLDCDRDGTVRSVDGLTRMAVASTNSKNLDCYKQLSSIGLNTKEVAFEISKFTPTKEATVNNWIVGGLQFLCDKMKSAIEQETPLDSEIDDTPKFSAPPRPLPIASSPKTGFDPSRPSPLLRFRK